MLDDPIIHQYVDDREERIIVRWQLLILGGYARASVGKLADDPQDGHDIVEWIATQGWSDGKVGTFGTSYPGGTQHALAETSPPHLATMIPIDSLSNCGVSGMRHGGAFELRFMNWVFQIGAPNSKAALANPRLRQALMESGLRIRQHADSLPLRTGTTPLRVVPEYEAWLVEAMRSGPEAPFWHAKGMSVIDHINGYADVTMLHITGWYDSWTRQVTMNYEALSRAKKSPQRLVIGPWTHGGQGSQIAGEVEFTPEAAIDLLAYRLRWYDPGSRESRTAWMTTLRFYSTSWGRATITARAAAGSSTADSGVPSTSGLSPAPGDGLSPSRRRQTRHGTA